MYVCMSWHGSHHHYHHRQHTLIKSQDAEIEALHKVLQTEKETNGARRAYLETQSGVVGAAVAGQGGIIPQGSIGTGIGGDEGLEVCM